jgi:uncharacterized membrane protein YciS (DUF1049 family)
VVDVVEDVFRVANGLEEELNEGESNGVEQVFLTLNANNHWEMSFEDVHHENNFDLMVLEDVMKEFFVGFKCIKMVATIFFMNLCMVHGVNNKFVDEFFALL